VLFGTALVYETLTTVIPWLSPLLGVGFYFWRKHYRDKNYYFPIFLFFLYTLYFEIDHDMPLFSFLMLALFYHYFLAKYVESSLYCDICKGPIYILYAYLGYYLFTLFSAFLFNMPMPPFSYDYLIYIVTDFLIAVLLL
jgi:hypothetical protein